MNLFKRANSVPENTYFKIERGFFCQDRAASENREVLGFGGVNYVYSCQVVFGIHNSIGLVCFIVDGTKHFDKPLQNFQFDGPIISILPSYFREANTQFFFFEFVEDRSILRKSDKSSPAVDIKSTAVSEEFQMAIDFALKNRLA